MTASTGSHQLRRSVATPATPTLGGAGLRAFANIAEAWQLSVAEQQTLLGIDSRSTFFKLRSERNPKLKRDTLERLSYLLGIYKSLQILLPDPKGAASLGLRTHSSAAERISGSPSTAMRTA